MSLFSDKLPRDQLGGGGEQFPLGLLHDAALQGLGGVVRQNFDRFLQNDPSAVWNFVDEMNRGARDLDPTGEGGFMDFQPVEPLTAERGDERRADLQVVKGIARDIQGCGDFDRALGRREALFMDQRNLRYSRTEGIVAGAQG